MDYCYMDETRNRSIENFGTSSIINISKRNITPYEKGLSLKWKNAENGENGKMTHKKRFQKIRQIYSFKNTLLE